MSELAELVGGALRVPDLNAIQVRLVLENGEQYGPAGHLDFADQTVDPSTGSQTLRARFPNPDRMLLPGQFVRARIVAGTRRDGIEIPERAVQISNEEASVLVVEQGNVVAKRTVALGGQSGGKWIVQSGLRGGDLLIVDGWMKVQPGQKVTPRKVNAARPAAPASTAGGAPGSARPAAAAGTR